MTHTKAQRGAAAAQVTSRLRTRAGAVRTTRSEAGGLIAIGGPPLGGKSVLAAHLAECLPYAVKIETIDDLSRAQPYWLPEGPGGRVTHLGTDAMLRRAKQIWRMRQGGTAPTILVVARFPTRAERQLAKVAARSVGMRFLLVEARSHDLRALRRIPMSFLSREELDVRLARYDAAQRAYRPVGAGEAALLPAVCLGRVQADLQRAVGRVLESW